MSDEYDLTVHVQIFEDLVLQGLNFPDMTCDAFPNRNPDGEIMFVGPSERPDRVDT